MIRTFALLLPVVFPLAAGCQRSGSPECGPGALAPSRSAVAITPAGAQPFEARIASLGSAGFVVFWSEGEVEEDTDLYARFVSRDGIVGNTFRRITQVAGRSDRMRVAAGPSGIGLVWRDDRFGRNEAFGTVVGPDLGTPAAPTVFRSPEFDDTQSPEPAVAVLGTAFGVVWNGRAPDQLDHLYAQGMDEAGQAIGEPVALVPGLLDRARPPAVTTFDGGLAVSDAESRFDLPDPPDIFGYVYGSAGELREFRVSETAPAARPEIAGLGPIVGLFYCDRGTGLDELWFATFDTGGIVLPERRVSEGALPVCAHSVAAGRGAFHVVFHETNTSGNLQIAFRTWGADGSTAGSKHLLGSGPDVMAARPDVAWDGKAAGTTWLEQDSNGIRRVWFRPLGCPGGS